MTVNKLSNIAGCCEWKQCVRKEGIGNTVTMTTFKDILEILHFFSNTEAGKSGKGCKPWITGYPQMKPLKPLIGT